MLTVHPFLLYPSDTYTWYSEKTYNGTRESYQEQYTDWLQQVSSVSEALTQVLTDYDSTRQALLVGWVTYRWADVKPGLAELITHKPQDAELLFYLGEIARFSEPKDLAQAQAYYQAYLDSQPIPVSETNFFLDGWFIDRHEYAPCQLLAYTRLAGIAWEEGDWPAAEQHYRAAVACAPDNQLAPHGLLARLLGKQGRIEEALPLLQRGLTNYADTAWDGFPYDTPCEYYEELEQWMKSNFRYTYRYHERGFVRYAEDAMDLFEYGTGAGLPLAQIDPMARWAINLLKPRQKEAPSFYAKTPTYSSQKERDIGFRVFGQLLARYARGLINLGEKEAAWQAVDTLMTWDGEHWMLEGLVEMLEK